MKLTPGNRDRDQTGELSHPVKGLPAPSDGARLEERALRWQQMLESTQFGLACASVADDTFLDVSRTFASQRGYTREELIGQPIWRVYPPEALPGQRERLPIIDQTGHLVYETIHQRKDGSCFPVLMEVALVVDNDGRKLSRVAYVLDLTEKKRTEASLEQAERRLRLSLDSARVGTFDWDIKSGRVECSRWHQECLGFSIGEYDGSFASFQGRVHPDDLERFNQELARCQDSGDPFAFEFRVCWPDGTVHWGASEGRFEYNRKGEAVRLRGVTRDVTAAKEAEQAMQTSEARFRSTLDSILEGCQIVGFDWRYIYINDAAARQNRRPKAELIGRTVREVWPGIESTALYAAERRCLERRVSERFENRFVFPDGHYGWFELSLQPVPEGMLILSVDITEQKRAEEEFKASLSQRVQTEDALRRRNEELVRFSYTVSHDLKSPLVTIQTFLGYLEKDLHRGDLAQVETDLAYVHRAAKKMAELLEELLELSRVGRKTNPAEEFTVQSVAREAIDLVAGAIAARQVQVRVCELPIMLCGDRVRLVEVYQNLIENAVKFMADQPSPLIEIGADLSGPEPVLYVRDNGKGIDPRHQGKLFGLFEKLDPESPGSGIGLALVQRIVEVHGGRVWVESAGPGQGTTFFFTLSRTKRL